jgi:hypothetical protein
LTDAKPSPTGRRRAAVLAAIAASKPQAPPTKPAVPSVKKAAPPATTKAPVIRSRADARAYVEKQLGHPLGKPPADKAPKADPDLNAAAHGVHWLATLSPTTLQVLRRYTRHIYGELAPESSFSPLPVLPTVPPPSETAAPPAPHTVIE